jgi:hypothetical protein
MYIKVFYETKPASRSNHILRFDFFADDKGLQNNERTRRARQAGFADGAGNPTVRGFAASPAFKKNPRNQRIFPVRSARLA